MNTKQVIFILDDDESVALMIEQYLKDSIPDNDIYSFTKCVDMYEHSEFYNMSLLIIDIKLSNKVHVNEIAYELNNNDFNIPYLFISGKNYDYECFNKYDYTYDFIKKPFDLNELLNRVKVLLKVSKTYKLHATQQSKLQVSLKELFDYTNIYLLILDCNMKIKMCSYKLGTDLGFDHETEIIGLSWKQFIKEKDITKIENVLKNVVDDTKKYQKFLREVTNKIVTRSGTTINVKWFNSRIKNGQVYTFSIGIPYNRKVTPLDDIDSIRSYWKHVLDKDETTLKALRNVV